MYRAHSARAHDPEELSSRLTTALGSPGVSVGGWCLIPSPLAAEVMALAGYDWIVIDTQHGTIGYDAMVEMIRALALHGVPSLVRVGWNSPSEIMRALDAGANGIIVPMISGVDDAAKAVAATRYPPDGFRSWGPVRAALGDPTFSPATANERVVCIPMIETVASAESSAEIAALDGVDALLIGPADLALASGGRLDPLPLHAELLTKTVRACAAAGIPAGTSCGSSADVPAIQEQGFGFVAVSCDFALLSEAATASIGTAVQGSIHADTPAAAAP